MFVEGGATEHETLKIKEKVLLKMARRKMPQPNTKILEIQKSRVVLDRTSGRNRPQQNKTILQKNNQKLDSLVECTPWERQRPSGLRLRIQESVLEGLGDRDPVYTPWGTRPRQLNPNSWAVYRNRSSFMGSTKNRWESVEGCAYQLASMRLNGNPIKYYKCMKVGENRWMWLKILHSIGIIGGPMGPHGVYRGDLNR